MPGFSGNKSGLVFDHDLLLAISISVIHHSRTAASGTAPRPPWRYPHPDYTWTRLCPSDVVSPQSPKKAAKLVKFWRYERLK